MNDNKHSKIAWLDKPVFPAFPLFSWEKLILSLIIILAVMSRFIMIGARVMSHDEINHVTPAYSLYQGNGYAHNPVTHGPFQFHMLALSYFVLGDSDFSSRVPAAFFSLCAVIFVLFAFRRYLGRIGALFGGLFFLVSPYTLYYGRYTRNEAFIELFAVMTFYAFFRYYNKRDNKSLYLLAVTTALQFTTKEVAYIYSAQFLLFCGFMFLRELWKMPWESTKKRADAATIFLLSLLMLLGAVLVSFIMGGSGETPLLTLVLGGLGVLGIIVLIIYTVRALSWKVIRTSPSFNLIAFLGALILPQLAAFPVAMLGWDPLDYSLSGIMHTGAVLVLFVILSFALGIWWNRSVFLKSAAAFYMIFVFFYTTIFSNMHGFFTGIIGSLGYWISQQNVQRGGQPLYYYALIQLPVYEFAAIAGTILALVIAVKKRKFWTVPGEMLSESPEDEIILIPESAEEDLNDIEVSEILNEDVSAEPAASSVPQKEKQVPVLLFLIYWGISSLIAYSIAGEKMPWLTVHIAMPPVEETVFKERLIRTAWTDHNGLLPFRGCGFTEQHPASVLRKRPRTAPCYFPSGHRNAVPSCRHPYGPQQLEKLARIDRYGSSVPLHHDHLYHAADPDSVCFELYKLRQRQRTPDLCSRRPGFKSCVRNDRGDGDPHRTGQSDLCCL